MSLECMLDLTSYYQRYSEPQSLPVMDGFFLIYVLILGCADQDTADWQDYRRRPPVILSLLRVSVLLRSIFSLSHSVCLSPALCRCVSRVPFRCCNWLAIDSAIERLLRCDVSSYQAESHRLTNPVCVMYVVPAPLSKTI